jgi:hypothetical protein
MKQLFTFIAAILFAGQLSAQTVMKIYQNNGTVLQVPLSTIDSITYHIAGASSISTAAITDISAFAAESGGNIPNDGGSPVTARGVCWSTTSGPTIADGKTTDGTGTGSFVSVMSGLSASTLYYVRSYATTSVGTSYGDELTFTTSAPPFSVLLSDFDGSGASANSFFSFSNNISTSDSTDNIHDPVPGAYSGTKYWKIKGATTTYYLDGFGTTGMGPFNFDMKDSIVFYMNCSNTDAWVSFRLTDKKQGSFGQGEDFIFDFHPATPNTWIRCSVCINQLISDQYQPDYMSFPSTHTFYPSLMDIDRLGFNILTNPTTGPVEVSFDDIRIVRVP